MIRKKHRKDVVRGKLYFDIEGFGTDRRTDNDPDCAPKFVSTRKCHPRSLHDQNKCHARTCPEGMKPVYDIRDMVCLCGAK